MIPNLQIVILDTGCIKCSEIKDLYLKCDNKFCFDLDL